jgi:hemerythrin-like metal-binding protein
METILWTDEFRLDIEELDNQHKYLIEIINDLRAAIEADKNDKHLYIIIKNLQNYSRIHFGTEEKYFERFNYPLSEEHIKQHKEFSEQINKFKSEFEKQTPQISYELLSYLIEWIYSHIATDDKNYTECFKANGL